jgi:uncharacterized membrane protein
MFTWLRRKFLTGLIILLPTVLTGWILFRLFASVDSILRPIVARYPFLDIPGLGFITVVIILLLTGIFAGNFIGRRIIHWVEKGIGQIPLVSRLYTAFKQMSEVFLQEKRTAFRRAIILEYPRRGVYSVGFVTSTWTYRDSGGTDRTFINVFLPTTPIPTSGLFLMIPEEDAIPMSCSVEEALKMVISGGAIISSIPAIDAAREAAEGGESAPTDASPRE